MKTTSLKKKSKNFYYIVLSLIKLNYYPQQIADKFSISKQKVNYYIATLKAEGCIRKISQGAWIYIKPYEGKRVKKINLGNYTQPHSKVVSLLNDKNIRGHAFMSHLKLRKIRNWTNRRKFLDKRGIKYTLR